MKYLAALTGLVACCLQLAGPGQVEASADSGWKRLPVVPKLSGQSAGKLARDVKASRKAGHRRWVFMKVGDSNTEMAGVFYGFGCRQARLGGRVRLRPVIGRYNRVRLPADLALEGCGRVTSFSRRSNAVRSASWSTWALEPSFLYEETIWQVSPLCEPEETPLECEVRILRPVFAFVMTGTNDVHLDTAYGVVPGSQTRARISKLILAIRKLGSVPVLSTLPPFEQPGIPEEAIDDTNAAIAQVAKELQVPLVNLWAGLTRPQMLNHGLSDDDLHLRVLPHEGPVLYPVPGIFSSSINLGDEGLRYGVNYRNLILLRTLAALDAAASPLP